MEEVLASQMLHRLLSWETPSADLPGNYETPGEIKESVVLGIAFSVVLLVAAQRMYWSYSYEGAETTVTTHFYSLILITSTLRAVWFLLPDNILKVSFTPSAVMAFSHDLWVSTFFHDLIKSLGSISLFSIFILILVFWSSILKKFFEPDARRRRDAPMRTFLILIAGLVATVGINCTFFLLQIYSSECLILVNAIVLAVVSLICVAQIFYFSKQFQEVLTTLGVINQVSTESQIKRIVWITWTGIVFFVLRAMIETVFAVTLILFYLVHGSVDKVFGHEWWDVYVMVKYWCEVVILVLMLYILQSPFTTTSREYQQVPDSAENQNAIGGISTTKPQHLPAKTGMVV